ncbi:hypothetical protein ALC53_00345 [Atta colombica]|uniref:Uncharacterized protein n=1 Tax=Atta colombica TaxID=520822 RepID=A0A195BX06_9HYME|nr:hypothetical protein ALC53_00345 [Atta colombica]
MHYSNYRCAIGMAEKLREAAAHGDVDRVACLLNENVKPLPDENGRGPLLLAAAGGHVEVCEILLLQGVDVSATDEDSNLQSSDPKSDALSVRPHGL